jgi:hypothetical protein
MDPDQINQQNSPLPTSQGQVSVPVGGVERAPVTVSSQEQTRPAPEEEIVVEHGPEFAEAPQVSEEERQVGVMAHAEPKPAIDTQVIQNQQPVGPVYTPPAIHNVVEAKLAYDKGDKESGAVWALGIWLKNLAKGIFGDQKRPSEG